MFWLCTTVFLWTIVRPSFASEPNVDDVCPVAGEFQDKYGLLRATSLAVRGHLPTDEETSALEELDAIPESWFDAWLTSPDYAETMQRFFDSLLWPNVTNLRLFGTATEIRGDPLWRRGPFPRQYRGGNVGCRNEPAEIVDGVIQTETVDGDEREGYVTVTPYWDPTSTVKVCAFDAQENALSPSGNRCDTSQGRGDAGCGCGPNLIWCVPNQVNREILQALAEDLRKRVYAVLQNDESLTELFESRRAFVNGPLVHYYKHLAEVPSRITTVPLPVNLSSLPDLAYEDKETWVEIELPAYHSGLLTSPLYLVRFQTNRARANQFYNAFMCQPFSPPPGGIPNVDNSNGIEPDLQVREGCKYCHALLEPAAAYWGRWVEGGSGYLAPAEFPMLREDCLRCAQTGQGCSPECRRNYVTATTHDDQEPYLGHLNVYMFRHESHFSNVSEGPRLLAARTVVDNRFPRCMAARVAQHLLGRPLMPEEATLIDDMSHDFVQNGYRLRDLTKAVIQSESYRRLR